MIAILSKPRCGIIHSLLIQLAGGRFHNDHIEFIKSCHQHCFPVLQDRQYRNILIHVIQHRIQRTPT